MESGQPLDASGAADRLVDVHLAIQKAGLPGGKQSLISGSYAYYHYCQDRFNDAGWGCAYRTLQTIISWFIMQKYIQGPVPTHHEIQKALVQLGDKSPSFIGSRQWIGAIELSMVLNHLYNIESRILSVNSGAEVPTKARELAAHFQTQGTPVMIGGGQLAYGLLGVDFNESTGECRFLILDPHYQGAENLSTIINKGWCGWKPASLFLKEHFYNFLLPQRPQMI